MPFKEEMKVKENVFMKDYNKEDILKIFNIMLRRIGTAGEIEGKTEEIKITQIDGNVITVKAKMKDDNHIRLYKFSLEFNKMENEEFTREAKIASPERFGNTVELIVDSTDEEKEKYFEGVTDYWDSQEEIKQRIEKTRKTSYFIENYNKENIIEIVDNMLKSSVDSGEIQGEVIDRKIAKIEGTSVSVAVKTQDNKEQIRIYRLNLNFDKMNNIGYSKDARIASPTRIGSAIELKNNISNAEKVEYYDGIQDYWDENTETIEQDVIE